MAVVRVFLCTYRRPVLLERAVESLRRQTMTDWMCELHNDDPTDGAPAALVERLGDPRIRLVTHSQNYGATKTLNLPFSSSIEEPFVSLLEDDNWWEPGFLERMLGALNRRPDVTVAWSDMRLWREEPDSTWTNMGETVWSGRADAGEVEFHWPLPDGWRSATHSHGAMLVRSSAAKRYDVPVDFPVSVIEHARERAFDFPILLVNEPLANFAITRETARSGRSGVWTELQTVLASTYFAHAGEEGRQSAWQEARACRPPATNVLIHAAMRDRRCRWLLKGMKAGDLIRWVKWAVRNPRAAWTIGTAPLFPNLERFLDERTRQQFERQSSAGVTPRARSAAKLPEPLGAAR